MKKITVILLIVLFTNILHAQVFSIKPTNPLPRVGDKIYIECVIDPEAKFDSVKNEIVKPRETCQSGNRYILTGNIILNKQLENTDDITIGPISINLNGKQYKSDSITLKVFPELPDVNEGIWVHCVKSQKEYYIILEQKIPKLPVTDLNTEINPELEEYTSINSNSINIEGVEKITRYRSSTSMPYAKRGSNKPFILHTTIYKVTLDDNYKNDGELKIENFNKFPKNINFQPIKIIFGI